MALPGTASANKRPVSTQNHCATQTPLLCFNADSAEPSYTVMIRM